MDKRTQTESEIVESDKDTVNNVDSSNSPTMDDSISDDVEAISGPKGLDDLCSGAMASEQDMRQNRKEHHNLKVRLSANKCLILSRYFKLLNAACPLAVDPIWEFMLKIVTEKHLPFFSVFELADLDTADRLNRYKDEKVVVVSTDSPATVVETKASEEEEEEEEDHD